MQRILHDSVPIARPMLLNAPFNVRVVRNCIRSPAIQSVRIRHRCFFRNKINRNDSQQNILTETYHTIYVLPPLGYVINTSE